MDKTVSEIIALGEGSEVEFKRELSKGLGREMCAFANAGGGYILIGVDDHGNIVGVSDTNSLMSKIQNIANSAEPRIEIDLKVEDKVLIVYIPEQRNKAFSYGGGFYIRRNANSQQMSQDEIRDMFHNENLVWFDEMICDRFSLGDDLDDETWAKFAKRAMVPDDMPMETALSNQKLLNNGSMTNAGAWLLARNISKFNVSACVSCATFQGTSRTRILEKQVFDSDICSMIEGVMKWILLRIDTRYIIEHAAREERPELPEGAIREIVVNALAHRDYRLPGNVMIFLSKDRLEISSPGGLPTKVSESNLGSVSFPRNPLLFSALSRMNMVENIGSGIRRARRLCHEYGVSEPEFKASELSVVVTFPRSQDVIEAEPVIRGKSLPNTATLDTQILLMLDQEPLSTSAITKALGYKSAPSRLKETIRELRKKKYIVFTIPDTPKSRSQKYRLTNAGRSYLKRASDS